MSNQLAKYSPQQIFKSDKIQQKVQDVLGQKAQGFITSVLQAITNSDMLAKATGDSVYNAAMTAAVLDLPINPNLGFAYIIPYKTKGKTVAQFQMGYKGYIQLCQRSGQFKTISATPIYEGQIVKENPLTGFEFNFQVRQSDTVVGYASCFSLTNGFEKILYMPTEDVEAHAKEYSQAYRKGYGPWKDDFESMALKTVLKLLLSKYAPMSIDMQKAVTFDQGEVKDVDKMEVDYIDNKANAQQPEADQRQSIDIGAGNSKIKNNGNIQAEDAQITEEEGDSQTSTDSNEFDEVLSEVNEYGKEIYKNGWFKKSKEYLPNDAEYLTDLDLDGLKQVKAALESKMGVIE